MQKFKSENFSLNDSQNQRLQSLLRLEEKLRGQKPQKDTVCWAVADLDSVDGAGCPANTIYPVLFSVEGGRMPPWLHERRGTIVVQAWAQSVAGRFFRNAAFVLFRETGF